MFLKILKKTTGNFYLYIHILVEEEETREISPVAIGYSISLWEEATSFLLQENSEEILLIKKVNREKGMPEIS